MVLTILEHQTSYQQGVCVFVCVCVCVCLCSVMANSFDSMDCSLPGSSVCGISQARILEWIAISFSRGSSQSRDQTHVPCIGRQVLYLQHYLGSPANKIELQNSHNVFETKSQSQQAYFSGASGMFWKRTLNNQSNASHTMDASYLCAKHRIRPSSQTNS